MSEEIPTPGNEALQLQSAVYLSIANALVTFFAVVTLVITISTYQESQPEQLKILYQRIVLPLMITLAAKLFVTRLTRDSLKRVGNGETDSVERLVRIRSVLTIVLLALCLYPSISLSGLPDRFASAMAEWIPRISKVLESRLAIFAAWFISGIGGWIGQILLGAMGSALWQWLNSRIQSRSDSKAGPTT